MLNIPQSKIIDAVEALTHSGLLASVERLSMAIPDKLQRCPTQAKPRGANGWFIVKCSPAFITITFGNNENGSDDKRHHYINLKSPDQPRPQTTPAERARLQAEIDRKIEADRAKLEAEKQRKATQAVIDFNQLGFCTGTAYTERKGLENIHWYQLRLDTRKGSNLLCVPFVNEQGIMQGYQSIAEDGQKRFNGSVGGYFWRYPAVNPRNPWVFDAKNNFYILAEGFATAASAYQTICQHWDSQIYLPIMLVGFNVGNLQKVIDATKADGIAYLLLVDNDSSKAKNAGVETAKQLVMNNSDCAIYPLIFDNGHDANDFILSHGDRAFINLLIQRTPIMSFIESQTNE